jgi:signal transduction histidine kinase
VTSAYLSPASAWDCSFWISVQQTHRAANLIHQILDFNRRTALERRPMDLRIFLKEIYVLLEPALNESITMSFGYDRGDYYGNADPTRMQQVLSSLSSPPRNRGWARG